MSACKLCGAEGVHACPGIYLGPVTVEERIILEQSMREHTGIPDDLQSKTNAWVISCFGKHNADNIRKRNARFIEEALELVQSSGMSKQEVLAMVEWVFNRDVGEVQQEVAGVLLTLAALSNAHQVNMLQAGEEELQRIWENIDKIREKDLTKPNFGDVDGN